MNNLNMKKLTILFIIFIGSFLVACSESAKEPVYDTIETVLLKRNIESYVLQGGVYFTTFTIYNYVRKEYPYSYKVLLNEDELPFIDNDQQDNVQYPYYSINIHEEPDQMRVTYKSLELGSKLDTLTVIEVFTYIKEYK